MPYQHVMPKFGAGKLHSGSKHGPIVKNRKQAIAIMMSEKRSHEGERNSSSPDKEKIMKRRKK